MFWVIILTAALSSGVSMGQVHKDPNYGYRITPPRDWPLSSRESFTPWVIGKFISKKNTYYNDPEGWTWNYKPEMTIVAFVHEVIKEKGVKAEKDEDGDVVTISWNNPYKDYKDYLRRTYYRGGFHFLLEEESRVKDIPVTCYEVKVDKLSRTGPRRIITWAYHFEDLDIAVQFEVLEKSYDKLKPDILRSLKSFRAIEREGELPTGEKTTVLSRVDWDELPAEERASRRVDLETKAHEKALKELPKGWKHSKVGSILVLDNYKPGLAKDIAKHCQAVMNWLDKNFEFIGPDEYVRAPILKVFRADDPNSIRFSSTGLDDIVIEYEHNPNRLQEFNFEHVSRNVLQHWFNERDRELYWAMPYWMENGLENLFTNSRSKGRKLEFPEDVRDKVRLKQAQAKGTLSTPRQLIMMGREEYYSGRYKNDEASVLVRFFLIGPGTKSKKTRDIFRSYLMNLAAVTAEIKQEEKDKDTDKKPTTEEEEDEYFKAKKNAWKEKEKRVLEETFNRTFAGWKDKDWNTLTAVYMRMIDS